MAGTISSDLGPWIEPSLGDPLLSQQLVTPVTCLPEPEDWWPSGKDCAQFGAHFFPFDWQQAESWCRHLNRDPADVRYRAIPRDGGKVYKGWLKDDWQDFPLAQAKGYGLYAVPNLGGDKAADITSCQSLFVEWDDIPIRQQFARPAEVGLPDPTVCVATGCKSVHSFWTLEQPISVQRWRPLMQRLIKHCNSDTAIKDPSRLMRLPGGWYIGKDLKVGWPSVIKPGCFKRYPVELFEESLPPLPPPVQRPRKVYSGPDSTLSEIGEALSAIPRRVAGQGNYNQHRNICWAVVDACHQAGYSDETAVDLLEAWSPSKQCGWDISQIVRSGGAQITAATLFHHAINNGWRRRHDD